MNRILGIDPGLRKTGWGLVLQKGNQLSFLGSGCIVSNRDDDLSDRLLSLHTGLIQVLEAYKPDEVAVESTFVNKNPNSTLKLGHARGIALLAPAQFGLRVNEYAPNVIKKSVIGVGHGDKNQISMMVSVLLPSAKFESEDAADALAIAICHSHHRNHRNLFKV